MADFNLKFFGYVKGDELEVICGNQMEFYSVAHAAESGLVRVGVKVAVIAAADTLFNKNIIDFIAFVILRYRGIMEKYHRLFTCFLRPGD